MAKVKALAKGLKLLYDSAAASTTKGKGSSSKAECSGQG